MNTHFDIHIATNTCAVKLGGVVFNPRQVQVVVSALHVLVLAVNSPDWPPVDTLLGLCCCGLTKTAISPAQKRWIPKSILVTLKYSPGFVVPSGLAGVNTSLIFRGEDVTSWADLTTDVSRTLCKEVIRLCMSWEVHTGTHEQQPLGFRSQILKKKNPPHDCQNCANTGRNMQRRLETQSYSAAAPLQCGGRTGDDGWR